MFKKSLFCMLAVAAVVASGCNCGGSVTSLAFTGQPTDSTAGEHLGGPVRVALVDAEGKVLKNAKGTITVALGEGSAGATLSGTTSADAVQGVAEFPDLTIEKVGTGYTLVASANGVSGTGTSSTFKVGPAGAAKLALRNQPSDISADGTLAPLTVVLEDRFGNAAPEAKDVTVALGANTTGATLSGNLSARTQAGSATFNELTVDKDGDYTLVFSSQGLTPVTSGTFKVQPGYAARLVFTSQPSSQAAGVGQAVTVTARDARGNTARGFNGPVTVAVGNNAGSGTLSGTLTVNAQQGVASFTGLSIDKAGTGYTLVATAGTLTSTPSNSFDITPAAAAALAFTGQPSNAVAGVAIAASSVSVLDAFGNTVTDSTASITVDLVASNGATLGGTRVASATSGVATFSTLTVQKAGTGYTLTASATGLTSATSSAFSISPAAAAALAFTGQPSNAVAGVALSPEVAVTVLDAFGNVTSETPAITVAVEGGSAPLFGATTVTAVTGVARFADLSVRRTGGYALTASATGLTGATSSSFTIRHAADSALAFSIQPLSGVAGETLTPVAVSVLDAYGNLATASSASITLGLGGATLSGTATVSVLNGVASFTELSIQQAGTGYSFTATSGSLTSATSFTFDITHAAAASLAFAAQPSNAVAGEAIAPAVTVTVRDAFGNRVTNSTANVTLALSGSETLFGTATRAAVAGVATFVDLSVQKVGTGYTLSASSAGLTSDTSAGFDVTHAAAAKLAFSTEPSNAVAGEAIAPAVAVAVQDAFGNTVTDSTDSITVDLAAGSGASLFGTKTVSAVAGIASFADLNVQQVGSGYALTAASGSLTGTASAAFAISHAAAAKLAFTASPANSAAGESLTAVVAIRDAFDNLVTDSTASVTVDLSAGSGASLFGTKTVGAVAGIATFTDVNVRKAGTGYTLAATSGTLTGATGASFDITAAAPAALAVLTEPGNAQAGATLSPVAVEVQDAYGNLTGSNASVTASLTGATLFGATSVNAAAGVAVFDSLSIQKTGTYRLSLSSSGLTGTQTASFNITAAEPNRLAFATEPSNAAAGAAITPAVAVTVQDIYGNTCETSTATVSLVLGFNVNGATLSGSTSVNAVAGVATFSNVSVQKAGEDYVLVASSGALAGVTSANFDVTHAAAAKLAVAGQPSTTVAGNTISPAVTVHILDAFDNLVIDSTMNISAAVNGAPLYGTTTTSAVAGVVTFADLSLQAAGTDYRIDFSAGGLLPTTSAPFNVTPAAASQMVYVTQPGTTLAGVTFDPAVIVRILDAYGNTATSSTASVTVAITGATLFGTTTVTSASGLATFADLSIQRAGSYTLTATSTGLSGAVSTAFTISAGSASQLAFTVQPSNVVAGAAIGPAVEVSAQDVYGNTAGYSGIVTLSLGANPGGATLSGPLAVSAANGVATFGGLSLDKVGAGYTLNASAAGLASATSSHFDVVPGAPARLAFFGQPRNTNVGVAISPVVQVAILDGLGNIVTNSTATVTMSLASGPPGATLTGSLSTNAANGVALFADLVLDTAGTYTLTASSAGLTSVTSASFQVVTPVLGYTDPVPGTKKLALVRNPASTAGTVVLDLMALEDLTGYSAGFNLPLDASKVGANATLMTPGSALPAGTGVVAAAAALPSAGPLQGVLVAVQSQKAAGGGAVATDTVVPAGSVLYTLRLDVKPSAGGGVVFDGASILSHPKFRAAFRDRQGNDVAGAADIAIGQLAVVLQ